MAARSKGGSQLRASEVFDLIAELAAKTATHVVDNDLDPRNRNAQLSRLAVQVWPLDPERLCRVGHAPAVMLDDRRDVVALEP